MARILAPADIERLLVDAPTYRSRVTVRAVWVDRDSNWPTREGDVLRANAGDWWVTDGDDRWSVASDIFESTYTHIRDDEYRKTATVTATEMPEEFAVQTLEGVATGVAGDWLVCNPSGECWPVAAAAFLRRYEKQ
ncbi:PGDYG domain-containing protein (plasmid) [Mycolicibacterium aichiense]|uniref:PGDYG domain-containing protein n=1 Tax=Mycolicibacterium aichiense TaxID=1799 RepID=UPI003D66F8B3